MSSYAIELTDLAGIERFKGTAKPLPGAAAEQAVYEGIQPSVPDGGSADVPFTTLDSGADLLDRSNPTEPTIITPGPYALTVLVGGQQLTAGGYIVVHLRASSAGSMTAAQGGDTLAGVSTSCVWVAAAGDVVAVGVDNFDGVSARNLGIVRAVLVKL